MTATTVSLRFQVGARTLAAVPRRLHRIGWTLDQALGALPPDLPGLGEGEQGYLLTSVPEHAGPAPAGLIAITRQRYVRHFVDLSAGRAAWWAGLSGNARSGLARKRRKLAGRGYVVERCQDAGAFATFHPRARAVAVRTYQERLLGSALPADPASLAALAAADRVRAWLMTVDGETVAFLCCTADGDTLRYDHVGHDPAWSAWSPGAVLMADALDDLFADRFARFDFTEGEGQHKRQFASAGVACIDLLLLRPTLANRALAAALTGFDRAAAAAKGSALLRRLGARVRR